MKILKFKISSLDYLNLIVLAFFFLLTRTSCPLIFVWGCRIDNVFYAGNFQVYRINCIISKYSWYKFTELTKRITHRAIPSLCNLSIFQSHLVNQNGIQFSCLSHHISLVALCYATYTREFNCSRDPISNDMSSFCDLETNYALVSLRLGKGCKYLICHIITLAN